MKTEQTDLIARLRAAAEGSRELDGAIYRHLHPKRCALYTDNREICYGWSVPAYTTSIDAALSLLPTDRMWFLGNLDPSDMQFSATITRIEGVGGESWRGFHKKPAPAVCIACLRARQRREEGLAVMAEWTEAETINRLRAVIHGQGLSMAAMSKELDGLRAEIKRPRAAAIEEAVQTALAYRDEADAGEHSDVSDPAHSLGQSFAANIIAKRIRALAAKFTTPQSPE